MSTNGSRRGRGRRRKSGAKSNAKQTKQFFGDEELVSFERPVIKVSTQPTSVVESLGRPPLAGQEAMAEHYFQAVYQRAAMLGSALAMAGELETDDDRLN